MAHLVTVNPDGSPQVSVGVWSALDGDEIVAGHLPEHRKVRNIRSDSRVALSIETGTRNAMGLTEYLVIYGTARIIEGGAAELLQKLAHTYLGPDVRFPPIDNPPPGFITHITSGPDLRRRSVDGAALRKTAYQAAAQTALFWMTSAITPYRPQRSRSRAAHARQAAHSQPT